MSRLQRLDDWIRLAALVACLVLSSPSASEALSIRICECSTSDPYLLPGTTVTLGLRIEGAVDEGLFGLGASVHGYNESVIDFVSGQSVASIFHDVAIPAVGAFDGLGSTLTNPLVESSVGSSGNRVLFFNGVGLVGRGYNPLDPGLDGIVGGDGAQVRLTFRMVAPGVTNLIIGTGHNGDGAIYAGGRADTSVNLVLGVTMDGQFPCPVPEPGTALLIGLGLTSLGWRARKPRPDDARQA